MCINDKFLNQLIVLILFGGKGERGGDGFLG